MECWKVVLKLVTNFLFWIYHYILLSVARVILENVKMWSTEIIAAILLAIKVN